MAVTGTTTFSQTMYQVIQTAFNILNVYGIGRTFSDEDYTVAVQMVNMMIKAWGTKGLHLWCKEEAVLYLTQYQARYGLGNSSSIGLTPAYATLSSGARISQTSAAAALGATALTVLSTSGWVPGQYIGVVQSDLSLYWTTILAVPTSTTVTLTAGTANTVNSASNVYVFTTLLNKPYRVISARLRSGFDYGSYSTANDIILNPLSHADYFDLPTKAVNGPSPNQYYYDPQLDYGVINLWIRPSDCSNRVHFTYERIIDDVTNNSDNFDLPQEWLEPLTWQLALRLAFPFAKLKQYSQLKEMATMMLDNLMDFDTEITGISFQPDRDGGGIY